MDVIFYETFEEEEVALKKHLPSNIQAQFTSKTIQEQGDQNPLAKLISTRTQSMIPKDWAGQLKGILTRSQGYDHLIAYRGEVGGNVSCGYLGNYCARAVAEQATLIALALLRKLKRQIHHFEEFNRDGITGQQWQGQNVFVVGVGNIGREIASISKGLGMHVKGFDIKQRVKDIQYTSLRDGVAWSDIIFCALPLTNETEALLNYDLLKSIKPGTIFVNIARGEISPIEDLIKLLDDGMLGGVGMDVYPQEAELAKSLRAKEAPHSSTGQMIKNLSARQQVICTPHNAFNTQEAVDQKAELSAKSVVQFLEKGTFSFSVPNI